MYEVEFKNFIYIQIRGSHSCDVEAECDGMKKKHGSF